MIDGCVRGGQILTADGELISGDIAWHDGRIAEPDRPAGRAQVELDGTGLLVLPGIVDLHGDAFERSLMPRPGVHFPVDLALDDTMSQLIAAGITTFFLSATDSWEPGLRSRETLRALVGALATLDRSVDVRLHVRHEVCMTEGHDELLGWIDDGEVALLSINDHTPTDTSTARLESAARSMARRVSCGQAELLDLMRDAVGRRPRGLEQVNELVAAAGRMGIVTASHDSSMAEHVDRDLARGVAIAEFPFTLELARRYRMHEITVLLGAPNLVRGGSHLGHIAVADAVAADAIDALCSDYHFPSLLQAPFHLWRSGTLPLGDAWALVASAPAAAAGLADRGRLAPGRRADIVVIDDPGCGPVRVTAVVAGGRVVHRGGS